MLLAIFTSKFSFNKSFRSSVYSDFLNRLMLVRMFLAWRNQGTEFVIVAQGSVKIKHFSSLKYYAFSVVYNMHFSFDQE